MPTVPKSLHIPSSASSWAFFVAIFAAFFFALATVAATLFLSFFSCAFVFFFGILEKCRSQSPSHCTHKEPEYEQHVARTNVSAHGTTTTAIGFARWSLTCSCRARKHPQEKAGAAEFRRVRNDQARTMHLAGTDTPAKTSCAHNRPAIQPRKPPGRYSDDETCSFWHV